MNFQNKNVIFGLLVFSTIILNSKIITAQNTQCHIDDWTALKALYESTDGNNWKDNTNWQEVTGNVPTTNCNLKILFGVELDGEGRVDSLNLKFNELVGNIPLQLSKLSKLRYLSFLVNQLSGSIPPELENLSNLTYLNLFFNQLSGNLPPELGNLSNLTYLNLSYNQLSGNLPTELSNLSNLKNLALYINQLSGNIPPELSNLSNLEFLSLSKNSLSGNIPPELGNLSDLIYLKINDNDLNGCYSDNLTKLCTQLYYNYSINTNISDGNNFDASWEDFCNNAVGLCMPTSITSFEDDNLDDFYLHPNPTTNNVFIEFESLLAQKRNIHIYDVTGKKYLSKALKSSDKKVLLPTQNFPQGVYVVEVVTGSSSRIQKLIIE